MEREGHFYSESINPRRDEIVSAIIKSRESFVGSSGRDRAKAYDPEFDRQNYLALSAYKDKYPKEYQEVKKDLDSYTKLQVETLIGERLNVALSITEHEIRGGVIYNADANEPLINMFIRGRDYRREHGNSVDWEREDAEIAGFEKIQKILCSPSAPLGTIMLSISPPGLQGSDYKNNFYDAITVKEKDGKRYIEARRYNSSVPIESYPRLLNSLQIIDNPNEVLTDDGLLRKPFKVHGMTADNMHRSLQKEYAHGTLSTEEYNKIILACRPFIEQYLIHLSENPQDSKRQNFILDAILNKADMVALMKSGKVIDGREVTIYEDKIPSRDVLYEILKLGHQKVRETTTGCGSSVGFSEDNPFANPIDKAISSPSSVADFGAGENKYGIGETKGFKCPNCPYETKGELGSDTCPQCKITAAEWAAKGNAVCT